MENLAREAIALGLTALDPARPMLSTVQGFTKFKELRSQFLANAGGRALALAESEGGTMEPTDETPTEEQEPIKEVKISETSPETPAPEPLSKEKVTERLGETNLPKASKARLSEAEYADEDELENAVKAEIAYVKAITGSGEPFGMSGGPQEFKPLTEEEKQARYKRRLAEVDGGSV